MVRDSERAVLLVLLAAVGLLLVAGWSPQSIHGPTESPTDPKTVRLGEDGPRVWPYTATGPGFSDGVSPINLAFDDDPETVESLFLEREGDWERRENATGNGTPRRVPEEVVPVGWERGDAASRYVYVSSSSQRGADVPGGEWRTPTYHLFDGDYFGTQKHLRVYDATADGESWTIVQVHSEHWDWFSLAHRVDSVDRPRQRVEEELVDDRRVQRVDREYFGNGDSFDADGWTTVVTLAGVGLLALPVGRRLERLEPWAWVGGPELRGLLLFASLAGAVLGIRAAGLLAETVGVPHGTTSKVLYAALAAGVPLIAVFVGRGLEPRAAFGMGASGFAFGLVVDYAVLSVTVLPLELVVHRVLTVLAVGLLATGLSRPDRREDRRGTERRDGRSGKGARDETGLESAFEDPRGPPGDGTRGPGIGTTGLPVGVALWLLLLAVPHVGL
jgi:hypothetical protein